MKHFLISSVVLALMAMPTAYADTVYNSAASFAGTVQSGTTVAFDGAPSGGFIAEAGSFARKGATFSVQTGQNLNITSSNFYPVNYPSYGYDTYDGGGFLVGNGPAALNILTITFAPSTAVGFSYGGIFGPTTFSVLLSDGFSLNLSSADSAASTGTLDFIGITSSTPITSITLDLPNTGNNAALDNIFYGAAAPEPSSFVLLLTGLAGAAGAVRCRLTL